MYKYCIYAFWGCVHHLFKMPSGMALEGKNSIKSGRMTVMDGKYEECIKKMETIPPAADS